MELCHVYSDDTGDAAKFLLASQDWDSLSNMYRVFEKVISTEIGKRWLKTWIGM